MNILRRKRHRYCEPLEPRYLLAAQVLPPFELIGPGGSVAQNASVTNTFVAGDNLDSYAVELTAGQSLSAIASSATTGLSLILFAPDGTILDQTTEAAGEKAVVQTSRAQVDGTYSLLAAGSAEQRYHFDVFVDAVVELETAGGRTDGVVTASQTNDRQELAQDLDALRTDRSVNNVVTVRGNLPFTADQVIFAEGFEQPLGPQWHAFSTMGPSAYVSTGSNSALDGTRVLRLLRPSAGVANTEVTLTADLSGLQDIHLEFYYTMYDTFDPLPQTFVDSAQGDGVSISVDGSTWHVLPIEFLSDRKPNFVSLDLAEAAAEAGIELSAETQIRFQQFASVNDAVGLLELDALRLKPSETVESDWYSFSLDDGEVISFAASTRDGDDLRIELVDQAGHVIAQSVPSDGGRTQLLNGFQHNSDQDDTEKYYLHVSGNSGDYTLSFSHDTLLEHDNAATNATDVGRVHGSLRAGTESAPVRFAVIGDWGSTNQATTDVAAMITDGDWQTEFIATAGDNMYGQIDLGSHTWEEIVGRRFGDFIKRRLDNRYPLQTSEVARFFPSVGNHDSSATGTGQTGLSGGLIPGYVDYFATDPGRPDRLGTDGGSHGPEFSFYDVRWGPVHLFSIDSDHARVDPGLREAQMTWLAETASASDATWKFAVFHHAPYSSSGVHRGDEQMQWDFSDWGIDAIFAGHDHIYERIIDPHDKMLYLVNGLGGRSNYPLGAVVPGSQFLTNQGAGATRVFVDNNQATFEFASTNHANGMILDSHTIYKPVVDNSDTFEISASANDQLTVELTDTVGNLSMSVELLSPTGEILASTTDGTLTHVASASGTYSVVVTATQGTGSYLMTVDGATGQPNRQITTETTKVTRGGEVEITFPALVQLPSVQADDLSLINGLTASAATIVDGDTIRFTLPDNIGDTANMQINSGQIVALDGSEFAPFASDVSIDTKRPTVFDFSVAQNPVQLDRLDSISIVFSEDISDAVTSANLSFVNTTFDRQVPVSTLERIGNRLEITGSEFRGGEYTLTIDSSVSDVAGNEIIADFTARFRIYLTGDANLDGDVDATDLSIWTENAFTVGEKVWTQGDFNGDGRVDASDFNLWNEHKFESLDQNDQARIPRAPLSGNPKLKLPTRRGIDTVMRRWR